MKGIVTLLVIILFTASNVQAQRRSTDSVDVEIRFRNKTKKPITDSILIIFDRYDRRGAGIIRKAYMPVKNRILLKKVPSAKYFIDVSCLNSNGEKFSIVSTVNKKRSNVFIYEVRYSDTFEGGMVIMPVETMDMSNLRILKTWGQ